MCTETVTKESLDVDVKVKPADGKWKVKLACAVFIILCCASGGVALVTVGGLSVVAGAAAGGCGIAALGTLYKI